MLQPQKRQFRLLRGSLSPHAVAWESTATSTRPNRAMAPLSVSLSSLLKHPDCLQRANVVCNVVQGLHHRSFRSRLWKRNVSSLSRGVNQLLSQQPRAKNYAASVCSMSKDGQDMTERLWSVYNETKRQTEGKCFITDD